MLDFPAPKTMAKALRGALAERDIFVSHAQCLDLVARQFGFANWNVLAARLEATDALNTLVMPKGWFSCGRYNPEHFRIGVATDMPGIAVSEAIAIGIPTDAFAGLMQSVSADPYRGGRVRFSAQLKSRNAGSGTIWLRVDSAADSRMLAFDNMLRRHENGRISGDTEWTERSIVLNVPEEAGSIHFGFFLQAPGIVWARGFQLEAVGEDVPVTGGTGFAPSPTNLELA